MHKQAHPGVSSLTLMGTFVSRVNITLFSVRIKLVTETIRKSLLYQRAGKTSAGSLPLKMYGISALASFDKFKCDDIMTLSPL